MNVRIFTALVFAGLLLSVIELACVSNDTPIVSNDYPAATVLAPELYTDTMEPELPSAPDPRSLSDPILTR